MLKKKFFLISLLALMLMFGSCKRIPFEPIVSFALDVEYERLNSNNVQGDDVVIWFTYFVGEAQYGWYWKPLTNSTSSGRYETNIDSAEAGKWLFYARDGNTEVAQRIFVNGVELTEIVGGKARATISTSGSVRSGW